MNRTTLALIFALFPLFGMETGKAQAQVTPPALSVNLVLNSSKYILGDPTDPLNAEMTIKNTANQPIVVSAGFSNRPFHLLLTFVDPNGKPITAAEAGEGVHEGGPPRIIPVVVNGAYLQVDEVEILPVGFEKIITIPDLRAFYALSQAGRYSVKAVIPVRTYATFFTIPDGNFAALDAFNFAGAFESGLVRLSLIADTDGDGYAYPEPDSRISAATVADCDDNDGAVNPGMLELPGDAKDNDCNPLTFDTAAVLTVSIEMRESIKLGTKGVIAVAILSTPIFDATKVDPQSITLEDADLALNKGKGTPQVSFEDVNSDGRLDLVAHVAVADMTLSAGDIQAVLLGRTFAAPGQPSVTIRGVATIRVIP